MLIAIDPGPKQSAYVIMYGWHIEDKGIVDNDEMLKILNISWLNRPKDELAIEMIAHYGTGMPAGSEIFDTCVWIGRFWQESGAGKKQLVYRKDVKMHLCQSMRAKDANIRQALIDRFGEVGTKKKPGYFYGFRGDIWSAFAVAAVCLDKEEEESKRGFESGK